jgi:nucleoside-triphosphatase THEP1
MVLEELAGGDLVPISQYRGPHARGCALDVGQLLAAMQLVRAQICTGPDLVILNKFGKTEGEGGGFRPLIAEVIEAGLPLVIAVPWRNIESWRQFAGPLAREIALGNRPQEVIDSVLRGFMASPESPAGEEALPAGQA